MLDDRDWILAAVDRYERPLLAYVRRLLHNPERSRDVVQDAFLQLCKQSRGQVESHLAAWLFAVSRRRAIDLLRKDTRMLATTELLAEPTARDPDPEHRAEQRDSAQFVMARLSELPAEQGEAVRLKFQNQFTYREIAQIMGLSESHVGVLLHTALKTLRRTLPQLA